MASFLECDADMVTDELNKQGAVTNVWNGIATSVVLYGAMGLGCLVAFECLRKSNKMVYELRAEILPKRALPPLPSGLLRWLRPLFAIDDDEVFRVAGMDSYVLLMFLQTNLKIVGIALVWSYVVLVPVYITSDSNPKKSEMFDGYTMTNIPNGGWQLWISFVSSCLVTFLVLYLVNKDWLLFIKRKQSYFTNPIYHVDMPGQEQAFFTINIERLPMSIRSDHALKKYLSGSMFPANGRLFSSSVHLYRTETLKKLIAKSENTVMNLEAALSQDKKRREHLSREGSGVESGDVNEQGGCRCKRSRAQKKAAEKEPTVTIPCLCIPSRAALVADDEVVSSGMVCCSKTVPAIAHYRRRLEAENKQVVEAKRKLMQQSRQTEEAFRDRDEANTTRHWAALDEIEFPKASSAYVTFESSRQAPVDASQILLSNKPDTLEIFDTSDPREIIWDNVTLDLANIRRRKMLVGLAVKFFALFLFIPLLVKWFLFS